MAGASLNDLSRAGFRQSSRVSLTEIAAAADGSGKAPRTDIGTLVIHWTVTIACIITLVTGLRLASDQEFSLVWRAIAPVLPQGEIWSWHIISGLALYFASTAYAVYSLKRRVALAKVRALTMPVPRKTKWGAVNVVLHWTLYGLLLIQTVTGFLLYLGHGGWWVTIHSFTATAVLIYIVAHSISHFCYGGLQQLLRLFRPSALVRTKATRSRPFLIAASVGSVVAASLVLADYGTLDELQIRTLPPQARRRSSMASWTRRCGGPRARSMCARCRGRTSAASASRRSRSAPCTTTRRSISRSAGRIRPGRCAGRR